MEVVAYSGGNKAMGNLFAHQSFTVDIYFFVVVKNVTKQLYTPEHHSLKLRIESSCSEIARAELYIPAFKVFLS